MTADNPGRQPLPALLACLVVALAVALVTVWFANLIMWWAATLILPHLLGAVAGLARLRAVWGVAAIAAGLALHFAITTTTVGQPGEFGWLGAAIAMLVIGVPLVGLGLVTWSATRLLR